MAADTHPLSADLRARMLVNRGDGIVDEWPDPLREAAADALDHLHNRIAALEGALRHASYELLVVAAKVGFAGLPEESDRLQKVEAALTAALAAKTEQA